MALEDYKGVFIFAQQVDNEISNIALELLGKARDLAADLDEKTVTAVLIGSDVKGLTDKLAAYGADRVIVVDDPELKDYRTEPYAHALASVVKEYKPEILLVGATAIGRDLGPRGSARLHTGLTADCTQLEIGDFPLNPVPGQEQKHQQLLMTRPAFGGNTIATIACPEFRPQMATVRPGVMQKIAPIADADRKSTRLNSSHRLEAEGTAGRTDRTDRPPETVFCHRHLRCNPARRRHGRVRHDHRNQQGRERADF